MAGTNETSMEQPGSPDDVNAVPTVAAAASEETPASFWIGQLISVTTTLVVVAAVLVAYHFVYVAPNKQRFATVDISGILELKELEISVAASRPDATDAQRGQTFETIAQFARDMETAIGELQEACGCTLLVRAAVVKAAGADDLTETLKMRLGVDKLNHGQLVQQLRSLAGKGVPPALGNNETNGGSRK